MNKTVMLCIGNSLMLEGIVNMLKTKNPSIVTREERNTNIFENSAKAYKPETIVVEVKGEEPYSLDDWNLKLRELKRALPKTKIAIIVDDENYPETARQVKIQKKKGNVDLFFYTTSGLSYIADAIDSL